MLALAKAAPWSSSNIMLRYIKNYRSEICCTTLRLKYHMWYKGGLPRATVRFEFGREPTVEVRPNLGVYKCYPRIVFIDRVPRLEGMLCAIYNW